MVNGTEANILYKLQPNNWLFVYNGARSIPTPHYGTFFCARENAAHFLLSGTKKYGQMAHNIFVCTSGAKAPSAYKRYVPLRLNWLELRI
jgi:hypothetical protein